MAPKMNLSNLSVKWQHNGQFRRFSVDLPENGDAFALLLSKIGELVPGFNKPVGWKDSDGDMIVIASDSEVREAVRESADMLLRLFTIDEHTEAPQVTKVPLTKVAPPQAPKDNEEKGEKKTGETVHRGVFCDGCDTESQQPINGIRYKCMICPDYDLCGNCEKNDKHPDHPMIRISDPDDKSWAPRFWQFRHMRRGHGPGGFFGPRDPMGPPPPPPCGPMDPNGPPPPPPPFGPGFGRCGLGRRHGRRHGEEGPGCGPRRHWDNYQGGALEAYLRSVGKTVSDALTDFGIDVDVDVEHGDGHREKVNPKADEAKAPTAPPAENMETGENKEKEKDVPMETDKPKEKSPSPAETPVMDDWTYVGNNQTAPAPEVRTIPIQQVAAPVAPLYPSVPTTSVSTDPTVEATIQALMAMGFKDDQGWLRALAEAKKGDINEVLNALQPKRD